MTFELLGSVTEQRGMVDRVGDVVVYVPDPNLVGTDSFDYRVSDPYGGWAEATVVVTVRASTTYSPPMVDTTGTGRFGEPEALGHPGANVHRSVVVRSPVLVIPDESDGGANGEINVNDQTANPSRRFYRTVYP